jgi:sarcosine oxidase
VAPGAAVAVIGLGAAGSAAALTLARRGLPVIGLDRFHPPHPLGSSHGRSRVIREAYYESPVYVPLVRRALELWQALEQDSGRTLLQRTGGLMLGPPEGALVSGSRHSAESHAVPFQLLDAADIRRRYPALHPEPGTIGVLEEQAGFLDPEAAIESCLALAARAGAVLRFGTPVTEWTRSTSGLVLTTAAGAIECHTAILAAGAWNRSLLGAVRIPLTVERQVMYWFRPQREPGLFGPDRLPVFLWEWAPDRFFYGIPDHGPGLKVARHHEGQVVTPDEATRTIGDDEIAGMRAILRDRIPDADTVPAEAVTCLYTNTPDCHFVLGPHPDEPRLIVASACSGHGFKFATVIGEILADLATTGGSRFDLSLFRPDRFTTSVR